MYIFEDFIVNLLLLLNAFLSFTYLRTRYIHLTLKREKNRLKTSYVRQRIKIK